MTDDMMNLRSLLEKSSDAVYESDSTGRYRFVKFELLERKRPGRKPGKRRGRKPGPKPGRRRPAAVKAAE